MDELTKKQKGFVKDYLETGNGTRAVLENYDVKDENSAAAIASENLRKLKIQNAIKSIAEQIPDDELVRVHLEGLKAGKKTEEGIEPDYAVRHKYLDSAYKLKGVYENNDEQKNINILMPVLVKFLDKKDDETSDNGNTD